MINAHTLGWDYSNYKMSTWRFFIILLRGKYTQHSTKKWKIRWLSLQVVIYCKPAFHVLRLNPYIVVLISMFLHMVEAMFVSYVTAQSVKSAILDI